MNSLVVPTDFSQSCELAIARALELPREPATKLVLLHVMKPGEARVEVETALLEAGGPARGIPDLRVEYEVATGDVSMRIIERAHAHAAQLVVMGHHHRRRIRDTFILPTADRTLRLGDFPVLVVKTATRGPYRRPIIATDFEAGADQLADAATRVLADDVEQIHVVHAYHVPTPNPHAIWRRQRLEAELAADSEIVMQELVHSLRNVKARCIPAVRRGEARTVILDEIAAHEADLVVVGTHARTGLSRALHEKVADQIMDAARCDVLVVPPVLAYGRRAA